MNSSPRVSSRAIIEIDRSDGVGDVALIRRERVNHVAVRPGIVAEPGQTEKAAREKTSYPYRADPDHEVSPRTGSFLFLLLAMAQRANGDEQHERERGRADS